jgi:hypothetical protein
MVIRSTPAALACLLGVHIQTAVNWASRTRRDWTTYIAERISTPRGCPPAAWEVSLFGWRAGGGLRRRRTRRRPARWCPR